jgi:hypothetical protein
MKKAAILCSLALAGIGYSSTAQSLSEKAPLSIKPSIYQPDLKNSNQAKNLHSRAKTNTIQSAAVFWSEDFSAGIPADWEQNGSTPTSQWEYRGPSTNPNSGTGSRGAFATGTTAIQSLTRTNGFLIFDSDFLDNGGIATNAGNGSAPAPHIGKINTDTIDLSSQSAVELKFNSYARQFFTNYYIAFSKDGGMTFGDTLELFTELAVNDGTDEALELSFNVSNYIGGEAQAMIQFIFAGNKPGNNNGTGYYFWMLDDIELRSLPDNELRLTQVDGAPPIDITFNGNPAYSKYGNLQIDQIVPISCDANVYNYGAITQTNVSLKVEILDVNGTNVTTLTSSGSAASVPMLDSVDFTVLNTNSWTPSATGSYSLIYRVISDSLDAIGTTARDTVLFNVTDNIYSLDWGVADNFFGTESSASDMIAAGTRFSLENEDPDSSGAGLVFIDGVDIFLSARSDTTADIEISIYDTAGFEFNTGFPSGTNPITSRVFALNSNIVGQNTRFSMGVEDSIYDKLSQSWTAANRPFALNTGTYFVIVSFFTNAPDGVIRIANSTRYFQPTETAVFQTSDGDWFGGFLNSQNFEAPFIRLAVADAPRFDIGISEESTQNFSVYPNPTNGIGKINFAQGGTYTITLYDMIGNLLINKEVSLNANENYDLDLSSYKAGTYLVSLQGEGIFKTIQLQKQ